LDSAVGGIYRAPGDYPMGKENNVLTVEFTVMGIPCIGLNGGPLFPQSEAFSFQVATDDQAETDRYWDAIIGNGGQASQCGWCKDRWGCRGRSRRGPGSRRSATRTRRRRSRRRGGGGNCGMVGAY